MTLDAKLAVAGAMAARDSKSFEKAVGILSASSDKDDPADLYATLTKLFRLPTGHGDYLMRNPDELLALHELAAVHNGAVFAILTIHYNLCMGTIHSLNNETEYVERLYQELANGNAVGVYLATELAYGNNVVSMETEAEYLPHRNVFVLNSPRPAAYKFMPNTLPTKLPKIAVVMARLKVAGEEFGVVPFLLPLHKDGRARHGITISPLGHKPGFALDNAMTSFRDVELPFEALLSGEILTLRHDGRIEVKDPNPRRRFLMAMNRVQAGKLCMAAASLGMGKASLHIALRYGRQRQTFSLLGPVSLTDNSSFTTPLIEGSAAMAVMSLWVDALMRQVRSESDNAMMREDLKDDIAVAKAMISWRAREIIVQCREQCGAQGLFGINKFAGYYGTINGCITAEGDNLVVMFKAARDHVATPPSLPKAPQSERLAPLFNGLLGCYQTMLRGLKSALSVADRQQQFHQWNANADILLELVQLHGTLQSVAAVEQHAKIDGALAAAAELHLLASYRRFHSCLQRFGDLDQAMARRQAARRQELLDDDGPALLDLIDRFELERVGLTTPISSGDYVEWYASQHALHASPAAAQAMATPA